jgi:hypothetical protein
VKIVFFMLLSGLFRRNLLLVLAVALIGLSELLRPTSTLAFVTMFATAVIVSHRLRFRRLMGLACVLTRWDHCGESGRSLRVRMWPRLSTRSSCPSRRRSARRVTTTSGSASLAPQGTVTQHSLLVGKAFTGEITVDPFQYLPWLTNYGRKTDTRHDIYSDFIIMMVQGWFDRLQIVCPPVRRHGATVRQGGAACACGA